MDWRKAKMKKTAEELYKERDQRVTDAILLKIPDRVPVQASFGCFAARWSGIPCSTAYYDYDRWLEAFKKACVDFAPDVVYVTPFSPGKAMEYLDIRQMKWPGHGVSPEHSYQFVEGEWMKGDEYDEYLNNPIDFALRVLLPRTCGAMEPFKSLPPMASMTSGYMGPMGLATAFAQPEIAEAIEKLQNAGREMIKWQPKMAEFSNEIEKLGFPVWGRGGAGAPFDAVSDSLRGMRGSMLDMYERPDKLLEACEQQLTRSLEMIKVMGQGDGKTRVFMALHRGADGFMSIRQFEKFYWPGLKKVIIAFVDAGYLPCVFFEGDYTSRLEYLLELPRGKVVAHLDSTDIFKAKEILKDHMCFRGNVPASLLQTGTPDDVRDYVKKLIDVVGKDGGLIVSSRSSLDEVKAKNLKTMIDFTKEYGVYN
jgi:uroporphyrinogen-III decarboxylase